ncbi:MAG: aminopeptidase P family N-terminal domain-containing protein [Planctomycetaceae bacterium]|nr:aminopeptidase P family N-terminal domain-containing protein [Planctomycetaceae bacterium]
MLKISNDEYLERFTRLQDRLRSNELDAFVVSAFESIYYLTGAGFEPLERPFFLVIFPDDPPTLLVPKLDERHMRKARNLSDDQIQSYREYPAPVGQGWPERLHSLVEGKSAIGVEPSLRQEIASHLPAESVRVVPLIEQLRLVKSPTEIQMIQRAARYADVGVQQLLAASYNVLETISL